MAIKKSELYSTLWKSCDKLRGGMDASQYKDYVLVLLFMKYVSDRSKGSRESLLEIPPGGGFQDLVVLKHKTNIGDGINKVIGKLADANSLRGVIDVADFNDDSKLGKGKEMVDRLSDLIAIFENPELDFSGNQADGDDLLGDAYEYLMRNFATESGKSKGQFYTPAEVSRVMASVIGLDRATSQKQSIYDPTCGSGSLLLKAHDAAKYATGYDLAIYGQEMDNATAALCRMNMWLHNAGTAEIENNNTLSSPMFTDEKTGGLRTFDFVVANPPFSVKSWTTGVNVTSDPFGRFNYGVPPEKNGDYAFLLHIVASLKATGRGAVILPHGVLFRGNSESSIRRKLVQQGFIKGIIGLPANLFYGTGIPACIVVIDKEGAVSREDIFMIDASKGFVKDGPKNRLRERDIHKIVSTFLAEVEIDKYSRKVPISEISDDKNDYNLNIPRYLDTSEAEDVQNLEAHLIGGIPNPEIEALSRFWSTFTDFRKQVFAPSSKDGFSVLTKPSSELADLLYGSSEFDSLRQRTREEMNAWIERAKAQLISLDQATRPKDLIADLANGLLQVFSSSEIIDAYAVYQGLMELWADGIQDDVYLIIDDGWQEAARLKPLPVKKKGEKRVGRVDYVIDKIDYRSELLPPDLLLKRFFREESTRCSEAATAAQEHLEELQLTYGAEDMLLSDVSNDKGEFSRKAVVDALKEVKKSDEEYAPLTQILLAIDGAAAAKKALRDLASKVVARYEELSTDEIKLLAIEDKWLQAIRDMVEAELLRVSTNLLSRLRELDRRYSSSLTAVEGRVAEATRRVREDLERLGMSW